MNSSETTISQSSKLGCLARLAQGAREEYELFCVWSGGIRQHTVLSSSPKLAPHQHIPACLLSTSCWLWDLYLFKHLPGSLLLHFLRHCSPCLLETSTALETARIGTRNLGWTLKFQPQDTPSWSFISQLSQIHWEWAEMSLTKSKCLVCNWYSVCVFWMKQRISAYSGERNRAQRNPRGFLLLSKCRNISPLPNSLPMIMLNLLPNKGT